MTHDVVFKTRWKLWKSLTDLDHGVRSFISRESMRKIIFERPCCNLFLSKTNLWAHQHKIYSLYRRNKNKFAPIIRQRNCKRNRRKGKKGERESSKGTKEGREREKGGRWEKRRKESFFIISKQGQG